MRGRDAVFRKLAAMSLVIILFISGCAGISHDSDDRKGEAAQGRIHGISKEIMPKLVGSGKTRILPL
jgi:hypothetical protein